MACSHGFDLFALLSYWKREHLSGDWKQTRPRIEACGIFLEAVYTGEVAFNVSGGIKKETEYLDNIDILFTADLEKLIKWNRATLFIYGLGNQGGSPSRNAGDAQTVSNIDAPDAWKIYEAWLKQGLFQDRLSVLIGLYDLNSEFDVIESAGLFLNSSHGIGADYAQSGDNGPSIFPATSLAARVKIQPFKLFYIQVAALDGIHGYPDVAHGTHVHLGNGDGTLFAIETAWFPGIHAEKNSYILKAALGT
jgi:porin